MVLEDTAQQKSYRMMFRYWLDAAKDEELELADYCESLKQKRLFTATIRDALRLIMDLRNRRLEVLFTLFPWVLVWLEERAEAIALARLSQGSDREKDSHQDGIDNRLARIETLLLEAPQNHNGMLLSSPKALPLASPDEEEITVKKIKGNKVASYNFRYSLAKSMGLSFDNMETDCLLYLLDNGKLTRKDLKAGTLARLDMEAQHTMAMKPVEEGKGIKKMAVNTDLPPPEFEDEDEDLLLVTAKGSATNG